MPVYKDIDKIPVTSVGRDKYPNAGYKKADTITTEHIIDVHYMWAKILEINVNSKTGRINCVCQWLFPNEVHTDEPFHTGFYTHEDVWVMDSTK